MQLIADRFEIERLVGSGGMGEVFRARDRTNGALVAVKVLYGSLTRDADRFRREAQILADINHPRIVRYVAHGVAGTRPYLAMEWLDGMDLAERLERAGLSIREALTLARRTAEALAVLHERNIVHRDIKPSNLFLPGGSVESLKVLDLGVARLLHQTRPSTRSGVMVGTPGYMAPEQARGMKELDASADIFSLGCVLYECIAGRPAFAGDNVAALLAKILIESPAGLREIGVDVPRELDDLVMRMLAKFPSGRPQNGAAVLRELEAFTAIKDAPAMRASAPALRAITGVERRLVSVVMATLPPNAEEPMPMSTFETMAASFDPRAIVASFGGEAEMLADGSIVVTLSGKGGASDQAAHAARCALALRSHLVDAHVALATGLATVTGRSCVGEVIERAAALLANARARTSSFSEETLHGQSPVFLDETTAGLLDMRFDVGGDDRGLFIRGLRERGTKARTLLGKPTPFVGRDRELATLLGIFEECVDEPVARAVLVTGQAGAGKSRMTAEFLRRITEGEGFGKPEAWLARGDPMSEGSPFGVLARLVRRSASITGAEPLVVRQQKLKARVARHVPEEDAARVTEFLGEIASVHFPDNVSVQLRAARKDPILMGDQMRRAFCDFVVAECGAAPVVLVIEDLHWGDLPSVSFIDSALRATSELPLLVLAIARNEIHDAFPRLWEQRSLQEIRLGPLVRRAGERLVREVLGTDVTDAQVARLLDRAAGNVFFLEELIRAYAEGRSTKKTPSSAPSSLLDSSDSWSLPGTVLAMVEARLERLDPMARRVLRGASVFGERFWRGGLLALTGGAYQTTEVDDWLGQLTSFEIVQKRDLSRFLSDHEYGFRHALVRDAAYQMLTAEDRTLGHRLAGEWLEKAGEHEPMVLGEHFERGGVPDKAAAYYTRAATQALEGNDFAVARARAERAIAAGAKDAALGVLQHLLAESSRWAGDRDAALTHAYAALEHLPTESDEAWGARAEAVEAAVALGRVEEIRAIVDATKLAATKSPMTIARVVATSRIVVRLVVVGMIDAADELLGPVDRESTEIVANDPGARAFLLSARSARAKWVGDFEEAALRATEAVNSFDLVGDVRNAASQRVIAGFSLVELGAVGDGELMLEAAISAAERLGLAGVANDARLQLGQLFTRQRKREHALHAIRRALDGFIAQNDRVGEGRARAYLSGLYQAMQEHAAAAEEAKRAVECLDASPPYRASVLGLFALALADKGAADESYRAGTEAMKLFDSLGGTFEGESIVRIGYAEALRIHGDVDGSKEAIKAARERLLARANKMQNPEWRRGFLTTIQENVRTLARAGEWLA